MMEGISDKMGWFNYIICCFQEQMCFTKMMPTGGSLLVEGYKLISWRWVEGRQMMTRTFQDSPIIMERLTITTNI